MSGNHSKRIGGLWVVGAIAAAAVALVAGVPAFAGAVGDMPQFGRQVHWTPYNDGTDEGITHEYVAVPVPEPEPEPEPVAESVGSDVPDGYVDYGYDEGSDGYADGGYSDYPGEGGGYGQLTRSNGVNSYGGHTETWYSTSEAGGSATAVPVPGLHVDDNGVFRDGDGYVVVASDDLGYGSVVDTSHGAGKVYDNFGGWKAGTGDVDIYTTW